MCVYYLLHVYLYAYTYSPKTFVRLVMTLYRLLRLLLHKFYLSVNFSSGLYA